MNLVYNETWLAEAEASMIWCMMYHKQWSTKRHFNVSNWNWESASGIHTIHECITFRGIKEFKLVREDGWGSGMEPCIYAHPIARTTLSNYSGQCQSYAWLKQLDKKLMAWKLETIGKLIACQVAEKTYSFEQSCKHTQWISSTWNCRTYVWFLRGLRGL